MSCQVTGEETFPEDFLEDFFQKSPKIRPQLGGWAERWLRARQRKFLVSRMGWYAAFPTSRAVPYHSFIPLPDPDSWRFTCQNVLRCALSCPLGLLEVFVAQTMMFIVHSALSQWDGSYSSLPGLAHPLHIPTAIRAIVVAVQRCIFIANLSSAENGISFQVTSGYSARVWIYK